MLFEVPDCVIKRSTTNIGGFKLLKFQKKILFMVFKVESQQSDFMMEAYAPYEVLCELDRICYSYGLLDIQVDEDRVIHRGSGLPQGSELAPLLFSSISTRYGVLMTRTVL